MQRFVQNISAKIATLFVFLGMALACAAPINANPAPAGAFITNQAETTFFNPALGITETIFSNTVEALVVAVPALRATGISDLKLTRGAENQHVFTLQNIGNTPLMVTAQFDRAGENSLLKNSQIFVDENANGRIDANEPRLLPGEELELAFGAEYQIIYKFQVVADAPMGAMAQTRLITQAQDPATGMPASALGLPMGQVQIVDASVELNKSVSTRMTPDGQVLQYQLRLRNTGHMDITAAENTQIIQIDGQAARGIVVHDRIPTNTQFVAFQEISNFTPLFQLHGAGDHSYQTAQPEDAAQIAAIAFFQGADYVTGSSSDLGFSVIVRAGLGRVTINNQAVALAGSDQFTSNEVVITAGQDTDATLSFIGAEGQPTEFGALGADARIAIEAGACNQSTGIDQITVHISSTITGDAETITAHETGPNTGQFLTPGLPLSLMPVPVQYDGVLASENGDAITARADCGAIALTDRIAVNPGSFVFNSVTNAPVADAVISVLDDAGAMVAQAQSDAKGYFDLGQIPAGAYRYAVAAPGGFAFPSVRATFPSYGRTTGGYSYGQGFDHAGGPIYFRDIPLDPAYGIPLSITKTADQTRVSTGGFVTYRINLTNHMDQALIAADLRDELPAGTAFVAGSAVLDGQALADPAVLSPREIAFDLGDIWPRASHELRYTLRFTPAAPAGDAINIAQLGGLQAGTGQLRQSNIARATVRHSNDGGVFTREATIIGSVFLDCNENGLRDAGDEWGVPGVKIVTQEGLSVVTDINGKFSFPAMRPVSHVLRLMLATLPRGAGPRATRTADMARPGTRMVALTRGQLNRSSFALGPCDAQTRADVADRRARFADQRSRVGKLLGDLPLDASQSDLRSSRSAAGIATTSQIYNTADPSSMPAAATAPRPAPLAERVQEFDNALGFVDLRSDDRLRSNIATITVKGPADLLLGLMLNGKPIGAARIGEKVTVSQSNLQAQSFVAVELSPGANQLVLTGTDPFGVIRGRQEIRLHAPGRPAALQISAPDTAVARARQPIPVTVSILDNHGHAIATGAIVTLRAKLGRWAATDIRPGQPGLQVFVSNGTAEIGLLPPQTIGTEQLSAVASFGRDTARMTYTPDLNERVLVGMLEAGIAENGMHNPFEDTKPGLRGEIYLKGRIPGDALLTLRYNSQSDGDAGLFRDTRADLGYPVYGDASERGFDAQSSTDLYLRVEKGQAYGMYGDIAIAPLSPEFKLAGYSRLTTGVELGFAGENVEFRAHAARTDQRQQSIEIAGRGISGPYPVALSGFVEGTDQVDILVRDAVTGAIIAERPLRRLNDYVLSFFNNSIIFNAPIRQTDADGNPISIRVRFETEGGEAGKTWILGGELRYQLGEKTGIGARVVQVSPSDRDAGGERIIAGFIQSALTPELQFEGEIAHSDLPGLGQAMAGRIALHYAAKGTELSLSAAHTDQGFAPSGSGIRAGVDQISVDYAAQIDAHRRFTASADIVADQGLDSTEFSAKIGLEQIQNDQLTTRVGLRAEKSGGQDRLFGTMGADWAPVDVPDFQFSADLALPIATASTGRLTLSATKAITPGWSLSAEADFNINAAGHFDRGSRMRLSTAYDISENWSGETVLSSPTGALADAKLVQGLDAQFSLGERLNIDVNFELSQGLGQNADWLASLATGAAWQSADERWVVDAELDLTAEEDGTTIYAGGGIAGEITPDLTLLSRARYARDGRVAGGAHSRGRARVGLAYRPGDDERFETLAWYEFRQRRDEVESTEHLWSVDGSFDLTETVQLSGKYAGQQVETALPNAATPDARSLTQLIQAGIATDFANDRAVFGINAMHFWDDADNEMQAVGAELGFVPSPGAMISIGYNHAETSMPQSPALYQDGFFVRLRMTLDDSLWGSLARFGLH